MAHSFFRVLTVFLGLIFMSPTALAQGTDAVPFQTLHTPKGFKVLFLENKKTPFVHLSIGFKQSERLYYSLRERTLTRLIAQQLHNQIQQLLKEQLHVSVRLEALPRFFDELFKIELITPFEQLEFVLTCLIKCLHPFSIDSSQLKTLSAQLIEALQNEWAQFQNNPERLAQYHVFRAISPIPLEVPPITSDLHRIRARDLITYSAQNFAQDNLLIGAAGNIEMAQLIQAIDRHFGTLPKKSRQKSLDNLINTQKSKQHPLQLDTSYTKARPVVGQPLLRETPKTYFISKDIPYSVLSFGMPWIEESHPADGLAARLLWIYLSAPINTALQKVCALKGLQPCEYINTYGIKFHPAYANHIGYLKIPPERVPRGRLLIQQVFKEVQNQGIDPAEFESLKQSLIQDSVTFNKDILEKDEDMADYLMLIQYQPLMNRERTVVLLNSLSKDEVDRVARVLLNPDKLFWVEVGPHHHGEVVDKACAVS